MNVMRVFLSGGPDYLPDTERLHAVTEPDEKVKVQCGAGYEHFVPTTELRDIGGQLVPVYQWCAQTRIAE